MSKRFVNLFGSTGSFTVSAAAGGAATTTTVDLSSTSLNWARQNMRLNGFTGAAHQFFSTNFRRFQFDEDTLRHVTLRELTAQAIPPDFRNKRIHRCWTLVKSEQDR